MPRTKRTGIHASLSAEELSILKWVEDQTGIGRKPLLMSLIREKAIALGGNIDAIKAAGGE